jgi:hypothetical protein
MKSWPDADWVNGPQARTCRRAARVRFALPAVIAPAASLDPAAGEARTDTLIQTRNHRPGVQRYGTHFQPRRLTQPLAI